MQDDLAIRSQISPRHPKPLSSHLAQCGQIVLMPLPQLPEAAGDPRQGLGAIAGTDAIVRLSFQTFDETEPPPSLSFKRLSVLPKLALEGALSASTWTPSAGSLRGFSRSCLHHLGFCSSGFRSGREASFKE